MFITDYKNGLSNVVINLSVLGKILFKTVLLCLLLLHGLNTLRPRQNGRRAPDDIFKRIFMNENIWVSIKVSLKFVPKVPINNTPALVQIMAWRRPGDKPLSEPMMNILLTHICVTRPQWLNDVNTGNWPIYMKYLYWQALITYVSYVYVIFFSTLHYQLSSYHCWISLFCFPYLFYY